VIGQPTGCYWLLKIAPFHSGFHPYSIIAIAADDASAIANGSCDCSAGISGNSGAFGGDGGGGGVADDSGIRACISLFAACVESC